MAKHTYDLLENLDEKYFSDILRLLLTTKGMERGFRTKFANEFVRKVYKNDKKTYALSNSSVFREYPLNITKRRTKNIDLLFFDLDANDDIVIGIENKFLGHDSKDQLNDYFTSLTELFPEQHKNNRVKILYLTLDGRLPINLNKSPKIDLVCLSWLEDIREIIEVISKEMSYDLNPQIQQFMSIINLLNDIKKSCSIQPTYNVTALSNYICNILDQTDHSKNWKILSNKTQNSYTIYRCCKKNNNKTHLKINVAFYGHYYALEYFKKEKFFIPINLNIEQAIHFIEIFCKRLLLKEEIVNNNSPKDIENIFCISKNVQEVMFKNALCKYLLNTKDTSEEND